MVTERGRDEHVPPTRDETSSYFFIDDGGGGGAYTFHVVFDQMAGPWKTSPVP